jgi:phenylalanyl-tRNA synthetase alpha chain
MREKRCSDIRLRIQKKTIDQSLSSSILDDGLMVHRDFGALSLVARERRRIEDICVAMGCDVVHGHELVSQFANFFSVNIPPSHPATEMHDTIFSTYHDEEDKKHAYVMRTHTSSVQNTILKTHDLPIRAVVPGKVYRFEKVDASHDTMFYQLE